LAGAYSNRIEEGSSFCWWH